MFTYFLQLNVKLLFVLILFGFIMGQTRHAAIQNFSNKNRSYLILDFFNLIGTPVHEIGHLLFGLLFGYKIDQICLYRTTKKALRSGGTLGFVKMHHENRSFLQKLQGDFYRYRSFTIWTRCYLYYQLVSSRYNSHIAKLFSKRLYNFLQSLATITTF